METEIDQLKIIYKKLGVDVGLKEFAIYSDGFKVDNPKHFSKSEKILSKLQKDLSRK